MILIITVSAIFGILLLVIGLVVIISLGRILPATGKDSVTLRTPTRLRGEGEKMGEGFEPIEELPH